jgi:beta-N-acetylglucosaminidase
LVNDGNATELGAAHAYSKGLGAPWDTPEKAIKNGAKEIKQNYVERGQNTLYLQRYNLVLYKENNKVNHQLGSSIEMAHVKAKEIYDKAVKHIKNRDLRFNIPIYRGGA